MGTRKRIHLLMKGGADAKVRQSVVGSGKAKRSGEMAERGAVVSDETLTVARDQISEEQRARR